MATLTSLTNRLRLELGDFVTSFAAKFTGDGTQTRFDLPHGNISGTVTVKSNGTTLTAGTHYTVDANNGIVTFMTAPTSGTTITVDGYHSDVFGDADLKNFLDTSLSLHNYNRHPQLTYGAVSGAEEYAILIKAKEQALWVLATDASRDIDIITVEGVRVPRSQRFQQLMALLQLTRDQYEELAEALNVGASRIEQMTLRRVSRMTNKLVPVFLPREVDDVRDPVRVYSNSIDTQGAKLPEPSVAEYDIQVYRGKFFSETFSFTDDAGAARDLTGYTFEAQVYAGRHSPAEEVEFNIITTDAALGDITITLSRSQTFDLAEQKDYVYVLKWWDADGEPTTVLQGSVLVEGDRPTTQQDPD